MADNFDEDDEYGKTVMMPSPFAQQKTEIAQTPETKEAEPPEEEPRPSAGHQRTTPGVQLHELQSEPEPEPQALPRATSPVAPPRSTKRRRSPALLIALTVLLIGAAAAAAIFIIGGNLPGATPAVAPVPKTTPPQTLPPAAPSPEPANAAAPTPAPPPASADLPAPTPIHVPAETKIIADKPTTKPKPATAARKPMIEIAPGAGSTAPPPAVHGKKSFLAITSSLAGVKIMVDGKSVGTTPTGPIEIQPGARFVTLIAPSGAKKGYAVEVESGDTYNLSENF